jgi:hypothetical protein
MLINDLIEMAEDLPRMLAGGWAAWLFVGLVLSMWGRREQRRLVVHPATPRPKSGVRPPSGDRAARPVKTSSGDAFGELEALLETPSGMHRRPGESPSEPAPVLAAPQSLP